MTDNFGKTTKLFIPKYVKSLTEHTECPNILEVGFGSGIIGKEIRNLNPNAHIVGVDMCQSNVMAVQGLGVYDEIFSCRFETLQLPADSFDIIIFASVLHEIGSYAKYGTYTIKPVVEALQKAKTMIRKGGHIIIRDGIAIDSNARDLSDIYFLTEDAFDMFVEFDKQFIGWTDEFASTKKATSVFKARNAVKCPRWLMQEFLCTCTWGKESFNREVKERFCYLSVDEYNRIFDDVKLAILKCTTSKEEYPFYFSKMVDNYNTPDIIGLFVLRKD